MKTPEEAYVKYLCKNCKNKHTDLCCIVRKINNTLYCENYEKDKELKGYEKTPSRTAKYEQCIMKKLNK